MMSGWAIGWMWLAGLLWFTLIVGGIALVAWAIARGVRPGEPAGAPRAEGDRALAALRERFARGEIGETEYQDRRRVLLDDPSAGPTR